MAKNQGADPSGRGRLPTARKDRRPTLAIAAVLLILLGALGSALLVYRSGERVDVLVAKRDIPVGEVVQASDFTTARVAADGQGVIAAEFLNRFVGTQSATAIPSGSIVNQQMFSATSDVLPRNAAVVGVTVPNANRPGTPLEAGDVVQLVFVTGESGGGSTQGNTAGDVVVDAARVVETRGGTSGTSTVTVVVDQGEAGDIAEFASSGNLAVVRLPDGTKPDVDYAS